MKKQNLILIFSILLFSVANSFAESDLNTQLDELKMPENAAPAGVSNEKLYSAQSRYSDLSKRFEFNLGGAKNVTSDSFLNMTQVDVTARYHINNRWNLALSGSYGFNDFSESARVLIARESIIPEAAIVKWRADLLLGYNLFYGKFRMSMDQVFYFDQYAAIGPGLINTQFGTATAAVADVGFALWFGQKWSARFGAKNQIFNEKKSASQGTAYHLLGHLEIGYLLGGDSTHE